MQQKGNSPKRHHINPQVLLREFADERERLYVVPKRGGSPRLQNIANTTVIRYANTMRTDEGLDNSLELALAQIEGHFPEAVRLLDTPIRTPDQDALILSLVVTQAARDPWIRMGFLGGQIELIYEALRHALRESDPIMTEAEIDAEVEHYGRTNIVKSHLSATPENVAVAGTGWLVLKMYEDLAPYRLTVITSTRAAFITADSPLSIFPETAAERDEAAFMPDTEFVFPITPRHAVLITANHSLPQRLEANLSVEAIINARTAKTAVREIYCTPNYPDTALVCHFDGWWASMPLLQMLS